MSHTHFCHISKINSSGDDEGSYDVEATALPSRVDDVDKFMEASLAQVSHRASHTSLAHKPRTQVSHTQVSHTSLAGAHVAPTCRVAQLIQPNA